MNSGLPAGPPRRPAAHDWSPINRMLASKRSSKCLSPKPPPLQQARDAHGLPRPLAAPPATAAASVQTASWPALAKEVVAPERERVAALQRELASLRATAKEQEEVARLAASEAEEKAERRRLAHEAEVVELQQSHADVLAAHDEERQQWQELQSRWQEERREWREERAALKSEAARASELRSELQRRSDSIEELRREYNKLQEVAQSATQERDRLMDRLEVEQAEMMARVEKLERQGSRR